jgi:HAD superfamily hydrolase (TIGR01459 family)
MASGAASTRLVSGVGELAERYDVLLLDQYGVLHDGRTAYPAALHAVRRLHEAGKRLIILSNSGRLAEDTLSKLVGLGFEREWFAGAVTSGETTHAALSSRSTPPFATLGSKVLHLTWGARGAISLDGLGTHPLQFVSRAEDADFVLAHGLEALTVGGDAPPIVLELAALRELVFEAARRSLPLIIANPDVVTVSAEHLVPMPGQSGIWYVEAGGPADRVVLMGKPASVIYEAAAAMTGAQQHRILAVGDSLSHDITGAAGFGVDSLFIGSGIHANELAAAGSLSAQAVRNLADAHACPSPPFATQNFQW